MEKITNLTQHDATPEQIAAGVVEPGNKEGVKKMLTFNSIEGTSKVALRARAKALAEVARKEGNERAMIGGALYLMPHLEAELLASGIMPVYAFSKREAVEETQPDGSVRKTMVFRHVGFVEA